jgi:methyl-accepting chemotaxis protein
MSRLRNLKIVHKVFACFALFSAVVVGATALLLSQMYAVDRAYSQSMEKTTAVTAQIGKLGAEIAQIRANMWRVLAETDDKMISETKDRRVQFIKSAENSFDILVRLAPEMATRVNEVRSTLASIQNASEEAFSLVQTGKRSEALDLIHNGVNEKSIALTAEMDELRSIYGREAAALNTALTSEAERTAIVVTSVIAVTAIAVFALAFFVVKYGIAHPLSRITAVLGSIAGGNFSVRIVADGRKDEIGQITEAVRLMTEKIRDTISEVKASAREVTNASVEISTATTDLSQRTEEQAASLEETSAAMEEIAATVKKNAENAQQANRSAAQTREVAVRGGAIVSRAVEAMAKIEQSSLKIADIIVVIDEIARQTNLLALNAAVEAARAGEAGRGFAVVASEVRSLAQRSSQAAKDIKDLIINSSSQVKDGVELVNQAGAALKEIVDSIRQVAAVVSDIANASIEQSTGIEQVNKALNQMDEVTQQNSALVEENAATAKTLEHQAKSMDEQVAFFQVEAGVNVNSSALQQPAVLAVDRERTGSAGVSLASKSRPLPRQMAGRGARAMQAALATAIKAPEWKEF